VPVFTFNFIMNTETSFNLSYDCRNSDTRNTIMNLSVSFDNPSEDELKEKLNVWLKAIDSNLEVV
jgi:hypothetical protein